MNGGGTKYHTIEGIPDQADGSRTTFSISLAREALTVKVNDVTKSVNVQDFFTLAEVVGDNGKFGFRLGSPTSMHFTDAKLGTTALDNDWSFLSDCK